MIALGQKARDRITGFTGIVIARTEWLHGCTRITIQPSALHEGKPIDTQTVDEAQCEVVGKVTMFADAPKHKPAGPKPSPVRHAQPSR